MGCSILSVTIIEMMALPQPSTILFLCSNELWFWFNLKTCWILVIFTRGYNLQLEVYFSTENKCFIQRAPHTFDLPSSGRIKSMSGLESTSCPSHVSGLRFELWQSGHNWISFTFYVWSCDTQPCKLKPLKSYVVSKAIWIIVFQKSRTRNHW